MEEKKQYLESIQEIRSIMERSSKFLSLSGLSGIAAGVTALVSGGIAYNYLQQIAANSYSGQAISTLQERISFFMILAIATIFVALILAFLFTRRNAKKQNLPMWDNTAKLLLFHMLVPLIAGGIYILVLLFKYQAYELIAPSTLIFYGLSLLNASKFTVSHTKWLGLSEIIIGLFSAIFCGNGLLFWMLGFGVFHIIYGVLVYTKFEKSKN